MRARLASATRRRAGQAIIRVRTRTLSTRKSAAGEGRRRIRRERAEKPVTGERAGEAAPGASSGRRAELAQRAQRVIEAAAVQEADGKQEAEDFDERVGEQQDQAELRARGGR